MIRTGIRIGDGEPEDTYDKWGLIYVDSDNRTEAPVKERASTSYAEEAGEHVDARTVQAPFDYTATFLIECPNRNGENANAKIAAFNKALYDSEPGSDIRRYKTVTLYNHYKRVKIVGIPEPISEPEKFYRRQDGRVMDCVEVKLKIRVADPRECRWAMDGHLRLKWAAGTVAGQWYWCPNDSEASLAKQTRPGTLTADAWLDGELVSARYLFNHSSPVPAAGLPLMERVYELPDTSGVKSFYFAFGNQQELKGVPEVDMSGAENAEYMFLSCRQLSEIRVRNTGNVKHWGQFANNCLACCRIETLDFSSMETVDRYTFPPVESGVSYMKIVNLGAGGAQTIPIRCRHWGAWSAENLESLRNSLVRDSFDLRANAPMSPPKVIQLAKDVLNRLNTDDRAMIQSKGYTLAEYTE